MMKLWSYDSQWIIFSTIGGWLFCAGSYMRNLYRFMKSPKSVDMLHFRRQKWSRKYWNGWRTRQLRWTMLQTRWRIKILVERII